MSRVLQLLILHQHFNKFIFPATDDEEWGDDDEWEWESEEEEENEIPDPFANGTNKKDTFDKPKLSSSEAIQNGINITITNHMNGENEKDAEDKAVDATGKADIKIQGNLLTIKRNGPVEWSDDECEESPAPPPAPPPPPPPPPGTGKF